MVFLPIKQRYAIFVALFLVATVSAADAVIYTWTDDQGTASFTEDPGSVPKKFRKRMRKLEETPPQEEVGNTIPSAGDGRKPETPADKAGQSRPDADFSGKTYAQWEKELRDREEAMVTVRKNIDEVDRQLAGQPSDRKALLEKRNALFTEFMKMKEEYNQLVDAARKAGLDVTIEK